MAKYNYGELGEDAYSYRRPWRPFYQNDYDYYGPPDYWGEPFDYYDLYDENSNLILGDEEIADEVRTNINRDPFIPRSDKKSIKIEVEDGVASLSGSVKSGRAKALAYADAFRSIGVLDVESDILIEKEERR